MNKRIIPIMFLAVVAIAAGFAFAPLEQVTTVHPGLLQGMADNDCIIWNSDPQSTFSNGDCV